MTRHEREIAKGIESAFGWSVIAGLLALIVFTLTGCSVPMERQSVLDQRQRENVTAGAAVNATDKTYSEPASTEIEVPQRGGDPVKVKVPPVVQSDRTTEFTSGEKSKSESSGSWSSSVKLPWAIAAVLFGLSLILIAIGAWLLLMLLRRSAAIRAAWATADEFLARGVGKVRAMAQAETDPERANLLNSIVAGLESDRADLNRD